MKAIPPADIKRVPFLTRLGFSLYYTPLLLALVGFLLTMPFMMLLGMFIPQPVGRYFQGCHEVLKRKKKEITDAKQRLVDKYKRGAEKAPNTMSQ